MITQATQSLEKSEKEGSEESGGPTEEADKGVLRRSSTGGFIVNKPDPSVLPVGQHIRHNKHRGGGPREQLHQRQPTLPSLPELEDTAGATEEDTATEEGARELQLQSTTLL